MQKQILNLALIIKSIVKSSFFAYWVIAVSLVLIILYNVDINFTSEGGKAAPDKGEFGHKGIVGELETEISSDNKYDGIEGQIFSLNKSQNKNIYISELDRDGLVGYSNSIAINKDGFPVISYHHLNAGDLKLAYCQDTDCSKAKIHLLDWAGDFGYYTDIASSAGGKIYISYIDRKKGDLRVIRCLDSKCGRAQINVLDRGEGKGGYVGEYNSLSLTKSGNPIISYFDSGKNDLKIASCEDTDCTNFINRAVVSEGMVGEYTDMVLDQITDNPIIAYQDRSNMQVKLLICDDILCENFTSHIIDDVSSEGGDISIYQNSKNDLYISYYDFKNNYLKLAICAESDCDKNKSISNLIEAKNLPGIFYSWNSITTNNLNNTIISFYDMSSSSLGIVYCENRLCNDKEIIYIDKVGDLGTYASLDANKDGKLYISYYDSKIGALKVASCKNKRCN